MSDDLAACAALVERGDPARFRAVMAAPVAARAKLFPLYAFNVEVARAPWVTAEPGIAEIRLQWWHDALTEIAAGAPARRHEVVTPLAASLSTRDANRLISLIEARQWDIYTDPFADADALTTYLSATSANLLETAASLLGQTDPAPARNAGLAQGLANWFLAVPALKSAGRAPLPDAAPAAIADLARTGLDALTAARKLSIHRAARPAFLAVSGAARTLRAARANPSRVTDGTLAASPFRANLSLMTAALTGRF